MTHAPGRLEAWVMSPYLCCLVLPYACGFEMIGRAFAEPLDGDIEQEGVHGVMAGRAGIYLAAADLGAKCTVEVTKSIAHRRRTIPFHGLAKEICQVLPLPALGSVAERHLAGVARPGRIGSALPKRHR